MQYGTDAIGGVIQVFTKEPLFADTKKTFHGKAVYWQIYDWRYGKDHSGVKLIILEKALPLLVVFHARNFGDLIGGDTTGKQHFSGYEEWAFDAKSEISIETKNMATHFSEPIFAAGSACSGVSHK